MQYGGDFLSRQPASSHFLAPEQLDSEVRQMADAAASFMRGDVLPSADRIEAREPGLLPKLLGRAAALGLLGLDVPEEFGGLGLNKSASARIAEALAIEPSFSVSHTVHTSVATLPIVFFGTPRQKLRYLPSLASGERIGAYALSESHAGSDAMAAKTRAVRTANGYTLTGEKMWITNAAFAGLFIVFAQTDHGLTAFIIERETAGMSIGQEERKLGLKGSSTCRLILEGVEVPAENVLGQPGDGGKIALYTLNVGRFKIAASAVGQSKHLLGIATRYSKQRVAFGKPIAGHGLIQQKLAKMTAEIFAAESMLYCLAGYLDEAFAAFEANIATDVSSNPSDSSSILHPSSFKVHPAEEYAIECAIVKVYCSETLDLVADETLQIHGGYGYTEEFPAARAWRDARVTRIYEGTNEINRLNIAGMTLRRIEQKRIETGDGLINLAREHCPNLAENQVVCGALADWLIAKFAAYCVAGRISLIESENRNTESFDSVRAVLSSSSRPETHQAAKIILGACGQRGHAHWKQWERGSAQDPISDLTSSIEEISKAVSSADGYPW